MVVVDWGANVPDVSYPDLFVTRRLLKGLGLVLVLELGVRVRIRI